jgi:heptosyltransferase-1
MKRFLIIKTSSLGDIVHAFPVVDFLKANFPDAAIDWVVEAPFADLVKSHPHISRVLCVSTKQWRKSLFSKKTRTEIGAFISDLQKVHYDAAFDLQGNVKSGLVLSRVKSPKKVGFKRAAVPEWPNLLFTNTKIDIPSGKNIRSDYLNIVAGFFAPQKVLKGTPAHLHVTLDQQKGIDDLLADVRLKKSPRIMVCPGSAWKNKQMEPDALANFLSHIATNQESSFLFIWGSPEEKMVAENLNSQFSDRSVVVNRMALPALQRLMSRCDLVISVDSLALHLAGTTETPTYSLFGPSSAEKYNPVGANHGFYQGKCPYGRTFVKRCPVLRTCATGACIRSLNGNEVYADFASWWKSKKHV